MQVISNMSLLFPTNLFSLRVNSRRIAAVNSNGSLCDSVFDECEHVLDAFPVAVEIVACTDHGLVYCLPASPISHWLLVLVLKVSVDGFNQLVN